MKRSIVAWHALALGSVAALPLTAFAEDTQGALEEVIVTAQKREQNLQDVGVSVTALSGQQLRDFGIVNSKDVAKLAPGVVFDSTASGDVDANIFPIRVVIAMRHYLNQG